MKNPKNQSKHWLYDRHTSFKHVRIHSETITQIINLLTNKWSETVLCFCTHIQHTAHQTKLCYFVVLPRMMLHTHQRIVNYSEQPQGINNNKENTATKCIMTHTQKSVSTTKYCGLYVRRTIRSRMYVCTYECEMCLVAFVHSSQTEYNELVFTKPYIRTARYKLYLYSKEKKTFYWKQSQHFICYTTKTTKIASIVCIWVA